MGNLIPKWLIDYQSFQQTPNAKFRDIGITSAVAAIVGTVLFVYWTRKRWLHRSFFAVKHGRKPPDLPGPQEGVFAFLPALMRLHEAQFVSFAGFDSLIYIRMYLLAAKICTTAAVYAWCVILPLNLLGGNASDSAVPVNNFSLLSMSNVASGSPRLWSHAVGILLLTVSAYYFLNEEFAKYTKLRHTYLKLRAPHLRTVMLDGVPAEMQGAAQLFVYFNHLYTDSVHAVACMQDLRALRSLIGRREAVLAKMERIMLLQQQQQQQCTRSITVPHSSSSSNSALTMQQAVLQRQLVQLNTAIGRQQTARLRAVRASDERVLREVEAGGYISSASFRPAYSINDDAISSSSDTADTTADAPAGAPAGAAIGSNNSDTNGHQIESSTVEVVQQRDAQSNAEQQHQQKQPAYKSVSIEEYLKRMGSCTATTATAVTHGTNDTGYVLVEYDDGVYSTHEQQQQQPPSFTERLLSLWRRGRSAIATAFAARSAAGSEYSSDATDPSSPLLNGASSSSSGDHRQPLLLPLASNHVTDGLTTVRMAPRAFVTFKTFKEATVARQVHHGSKPGQLQCREAPEPRDLYWFNVHISRRTRSKRRLLVDAFLCALYVFWVIPVTLLYLTFSQKALQSRYHWIEQSCARNSLFCTALGVIQPVLLLVFMNLLPPLIRVLGMWEGCSSESRNQKLTLSRYFYFQVINVFLVTTVAGTVFDTLRLIVDRPSKVFTLLGESLPNVCGYFCIYIAIKFLAGLLIELTRMVSLLQHYVLKLLWRGRTVRDRAAVVAGLRHYHDAGWFSFPKFMAQDLLIIVITFTFCCINPFILVISIPYFLCAHLVYKHQLLYVYTPIFETGGTFFPKIFRRFIFGITVAQATMAGVLLLKKAFAQAGCVIVLMLLTWLFKAQQRQYFEPISHTLPLELATVLDMETEQLREQQQQQQQQQQCQAGEHASAAGNDDVYGLYVQPELKAAAVAKPQPQLNCSG